MLKPDITAMVHLHRTDCGGRAAGIPAVQFGCVFHYQGEFFDCRLLLEQAHLVMNPGDEAEVPVRFLFPELIKPRLSKGNRFELWEGKFFADGYVVEVL